MTEEFGSANVSALDFGENATEETAATDGGRPFCAESDDSSPLNRNTYLWLMSTPVVVHATWKEEKKRIPSPMKGRGKQSTNKMMKCNDNKFLKSGQQCPTFIAAVSAASNSSPSEQHRNSSREDDDSGNCAISVDSSRNDDKVDNSAAGVSSLTKRGFSSGFGVKN